MTTQELKQLREKINNIPDEVLEKVAEVLMPLVSIYKDQYIVDAYSDWKENNIYSVEEKEFKNKFKTIDANYPINFYAGFKAAEKYHGIIK